MRETRSRPDGISARSGRSPVRVGDWVLHADLAVLRQNGAEVRLAAKALHVLLVLLDAGEAGVARDTLLDEVWGENYPSDTVVSRAIADLRSAFGETAGEQSYIRTLPKFGYQLVASRNSVDDIVAAEIVPTDRRRLIWTTAGVVVLALALFIPQWKNGREQSRSAVLRLPVARPLTSAPGLEHQPRVSPNGDWVVYAALRPDRPDWDLFRVATADGVSQTVAATPGVSEHGPAISPAGDEVAYARMSDDGCEIVVQSIVLGIPKSVANCTMKFPTTVDWSPDGRWLVFTALEADDERGYRRLYRVDRNSGEKHKLTSAVSPTGSDYYPRFSPSGKQVAFLRGEPQPDHRSTLWRVDVATGEEQQLADLPSQIGGVTWIDETTVAYPYDNGGQFELRRRNLSTGEETRFERTGLFHPDYHADTQMLVATLQSSERDVATLTVDGLVVSVAPSTSDDHHAALSPDEAFVAFISRRSGFAELWIANTTDHTTRRLTRFDGTTVRYPDWHPFEQRILYTVQTDAGERLFETDLVSGSSSRIGNSNSEATNPRWMANGRQWVYGCNDSGGWAICIGDNEGERRIASGFFRPVPLDDNSVAVTDSTGVLYQMSIDDGEVDVLFDRLPADGRFGWSVAGDLLIYSVPAGPGNAGQLVRRNLSSNNERVLYEGPMPLADTSIGVGIKSGLIVFTRLQAASDDLVIFDSVTLN